MVGSKTPVSILNEYYMSRKIVPQFQLIEQSIGHNPRFTFRVTAGDDFADGSGTSKQQAKHASAQLLLDILLARGQTGNELLNHVCSNVSLPNDNQIAINAVGELTQYCEHKNYPYPSYELVSDEGPPHARIFTVKCTVSNLMELGTARTKKQAKHHSAYAMMLKLKQLFNEELNPVVKMNFDKPKTLSTARSDIDETDWLVDDSISDMPKTLPKEETDPMAEGATRSYFKVFGKSRRNAAPSAYIADQYRHYSKLKERSKTLKELTTSPFLLESPCETLNKIAQELGEKIEWHKMSGMEKDLFFLEINITPKLINAGFSKEEAMRNALNALASML